MEFWKNRKTGKSFILIKRLGKGKALFFNPLGRIVALDLHLFQELIDENSNEPANGRDITEAQIKKYSEYEEEIENLDRDRILDDFEERTSSEQDELIRRLEGILEKKRGK